jgi:hypothetical protein
MGYVRHAKQISFSGLTTPNLRRENSARLIVRLENTGKVKLITFVRPVVSIAQFA